jgi:uncharacterized cupin superfamily protein
MATIFKAEKREFREDSNKIDNFLLFSDVSIKKMGVKPKNLNFDLRLLNPGQFSAPYHFHRFAEELFMVISGSMTLRTPEGFEIVTGGDLVFFEMGETGAHQFYNHTTDSTTYLDIRTYIGYDLCEYPDSEKILIAPSFEIFKKNSQSTYFEGEENIHEKWKSLQSPENPPKT